MIEYEKEKKDIFEEVLNVHNFTEEYMKSRTLYINNYRDLEVWFIVLGGISTAILFVTIFGSLGYYNFSPNRNVAKDAYILNLLFILIPIFTPISMAGFMIDKIMPKIPFLAKRKNKMEHLINKGISQQEQFNYLLFVDTLINKCSTQDVTTQKIKVNLLEFKSDMISICAENNQEKLINLIYKDKDYLLEISTLLNSGVVDKYNTVEDKQYESIYEKFVDKSGVFLEQYHNPTQKIKKLL